MESRFHTRWKFHLIFPHHKKGDGQDPEYYRQLLLSKMWVLQFSEDTIAWFRSYLEGSWFSVRVESRNLTENQLPSR